MRSNASLSPSLTDLSYPLISSLLGLSRGTARHLSTRRPTFPSLASPPSSSSLPLSLFISSIDQCILAEYDSNVAAMRQRLSRDLFSGVVESLVEGAPQLNGVEWEAVVLVSSCCAVEGWVHTRGYFLGCMSTKSR